MTLPVLEVESLEYKYPTGVSALGGVSLAIEPGERVALLGPNGAGKSTLILHLNGILLCQQGEVRVDGDRVEKRNLAEVRRKVGLVFPNPDDQLFMATVAEDVAFGPRNMGLDEDEVDRRVGRALEAVGLPGFEERMPYHLSTGEKKRASIATVLVMEPDVMVLDEPAAGLDPRGRKGLIELLKGLPCALLVATHDLAMAREVCSRVLILDGGKLAADGPVDDVLADTELLLEHGLA
ncbi:MAG: ATP-binding cassette domain-containing protein [Armatimonadia bacterium]|nr:ATP-binding cassette domain-containing protein [Armatimonadia bacterium]